MGAVLGAPLTYGGATALASTAHVRVGSTTPLPHGARIAGAAAPGTQLQMTVALQPRDPLALSNYATAVSTPGNPLYGHYLSVAQFAARFGATPAHVASVRNVLRAAGLQVGTPYANNLTIPLAGTAAQVENAFAVSLEHVSLASGRNAYANAQPPALPVEHCAVRPGNCRSRQRHARPAGGAGQADRADSQPRSRRLASTRADRRTAAMFQRHR